MNGVVAGPRSRSSRSRSQRAQPAGVRAGAELGPEPQAVEARVGLAVLREAGGVRAEVEGAVVDDDTADDRAVPGEVLRCGVHHHIDAVLDGPQQVGRERRVVEHERLTGGVRDIGDRAYVEEIVAGVAHRLAEHRFGGGPQSPPPGVRVVGIVDERRLDPVLGQQVAQVVRSAVQGRAGHGMVAGTGQIQDGQGHGRVPGSHGHGVDGPLQGGDPPFERFVCRILDARVDVSLLLKGEEARRMSGVLEREGSRLVDRHGSGQRRRVGRRSGMDLPGLEGPVGPGRRHHFRHCVIP